MRRGSPEVDTVTRLAPQLETGGFVDHADGLDEMAVVEERLAHPHEDDVHLVRLVETLLLEIADFVEDLARGEVPAKLPLGRLTEPTVEGTAHLARYAERDPLAVAHEHRLDGVPVVELEEVLFRAVDLRYLERTRAAK